MSGTCGGTPEEHSAYPAARAEWSIRAHELFESAADRKPHGLALVCGKDRLTFAQLEARSNQTARALREAGVTRHDLVVLALPRCTELFSSTLGTLKAGAAYVPVDPSHPSERIRRIIEDASPRAILTDDPGHPAWQGDARVIDVRLIDRGFAERVSVPGTASDIAYVLFTSGSTGVPKGVPIPHEGIGRLVFGQGYAPFGEDLAWLKVAPMGFDASTIEMYGAWLHGAPLIVWDRDSIDADGLAVLCRRERVGACFMSFGLLCTMLELRPDMFETMRVVTTGGEAVLPGAMRRAIKLLPGVRFVNGYGPTEATSFTTTGEINTETLDQADGLATVPIGFPLEGLVCRVLSEDGEVISDGRPGELCVGGIGLTPGYINRPDLNAAKFCDDPMLSGLRLYRTGDLVRRTSSGAFEFLGRLDAQVKVRGNRVELGEIDAVLERYSGVRHAAAGVLGTSGDDRVVALVVADDAALSTDDLLLHAAGHLPPYMVPSSVRIVESLPTTPNGKIDRAAILVLVAVDQEDDRTLACDDREPNWTDTERLMASLWSDVLGKPVRAKDVTFVALGGHSLKAMVVSTRLRAMTGLCVAVPDLLGRMTLADIARRADSGYFKSSPAATSQDDHTVGREELSPAQERLWVLDRMQPGDSAYTIAIRLVCDGSLDRVAFQEACHDLIGRHSALRTRFYESPDGPRREIVPLDSLASSAAIIDWVDARRMDVKEVEVCERSFVRSGFSLEKCPLIRFLVTEGRDQAVVTISMHHIISDGWSCEVIQRDLAELYRARLMGSEAALDDVHEDPNRLWPGYTSSDVAWWHEHLRDARYIELARRAPSSIDSERDGIRASVIIDGPEFVAVRNLAVGMGVTVFAVISAAFHAWLHRVTREEDLVIGVPVASRSSAGLENAVGFFMATVPMRTGVASRDLGRDVVGRVAASFARSNEYSAVPLQEIASEHRSTREPGRNPLFEVFLNHISLNLRTGDGDLRFDGSEIDNGSAKFDLTCYSIESGDSIEILLNARASVACEIELKRWAQQVARMLRGISEGPDHPIGEIELAPEESSRFETNRMPVDPVVGVLLADERVRAIAERHPQGVAFRDGQQTRTYSELIAAMDRVAAGLVGNGVCRGSRVVVACQSRLSAAEAFLGVLAAGACVVMADADWPTARLEEVIRLSGAVLVVSDQHQIAEQLADFRVIDPGSFIDASASRADSSQRTPRDEAYVLFTSGSTGRPKGVVQSHMGLVYLIEAFAGSVRLDRADTLAMTSSFAFDSAIMDMFGAWFRGAAWSPIDLGASDMDPLVAIKNVGATVLHAAPSVLRSLASGATASEHSLEPVHSVRAVVLGGEPAFASDSDLVRRLFPRCSLLINGMGMSESSLTLQWRDEKITAGFQGSLPIGTAVAGNTIRLVDADGRPTDLFGEIEISSPTLAMGYITSEGSHPIGEPHGAGLRRFRTGDLARMRPDGNLEHAGRKDLQIKVLGVRIEPAEVREALMGLDGIRSAVVYPLLASVHAGEQQSLCAAVVPDPGSRLDGPRIRSLLSGRLPRAMIPASILMVDSIPLAGNGKPDFAALRTLSTERDAVCAGAADRAMTVTEHAIAQCFAEVLSQDSVGVTDDFFQLGGNSLLALRAFARLRDRLGTHLPVIAMFRAPTPERLAALIDADESLSGERALAHLGGDLNLPHVYFAPGIGGNPHSFSPIAALIAQHRCCMGYQLPGVLGQRDPMQSIESIAEDLAAHIPVVMDDTAPDLIGYSFGGTLALQAALRFQRQGRSPGALIMIDAHFMPGMPKKGRLGRAIAHVRQLSSAGSRGRIAYLLKRFRGDRPERELRGVYQTDESLKPIKRLIEVNRRALHEYRPAVKYQGDLLLFRARQPGWMRFHHDDGANGWRACVSGRIEVVEIDLDHNRVLHSDAAPFLWERMKPWLCAASRGERMGPAQ